MNQIKSLVLLILIVLSAPAKSIDVGDANCNSLILVSSWTRNNVKIFDGCSGAFIKNLDSQNLINGPLGILEAPDGDVLVVSEKNGRLLKFDRQTLSQGSVVLGSDPTTGEVENSFIVNPVGAVMGNDGFIYAASFSENSVVKIDPQTWTIVEQILAPNSAPIEGIDVGMTISEQGEIYLPGFYSNNVVKVNLQSKEITQVIAPNEGNLNGARTIILRDDEIVVSSELSGGIKVYDLASGSFKYNLFDITGPTGMQKDGDAHLLINNSRSVMRIKNDGSAAQQIVANGAGDLAGGTFVYRLIKAIDSDNDGLSDEAESNLHGSDPSNPDTDNDDLLDGDEINLHNTDPLMADTDADGMPDGFEVTFALDANQNDANEDKDNDSISNLDEYIAGTNPNNDDTDEDGVKDGEDLEPLIPNSAPSISGEPVTQIESNQNYRFQPQISYAGNLATVTLSISNKPAWATFDANTGNLQGLPKNEDVGVTRNITITATNGHHSVELPSFDIEVVNKEKSGGGSQPLGFIGMLLLLTIYSRRSKSF